MQTIKDDEVKLYADFDNRQRVQSVGQKRQRGQDDAGDRFLGLYQRAARSRSASASPARLHDTCIDTGFFYLANHGISAAEIDAGP